MTFRSPVLQFGIAFLCFLLVPSVMPTTFSAINAESPPQKGNADRFVIMTLQGKEQPPESSLTIVSSSEGELRDIMSFLIDETNLKELIRVQRKRTNRCDLVLKFSTESDTSITTLAKVISRIKASSPPDEAVVLYLHFKELRK